MRGNISALPVSHRQRHTHKNRNIIVLAIYTLSRESWLWLLLLLLWNLKEIFYQERSFWPLAYSSQCFAENFAALWRFWNLMMDLFCSPRAADRLMCPTLWHSRTCPPPAILSLLISFVFYLIIRHLLLVVLHTMASLPISSIWRWTEYSRI